MNRREFEAGDRVWLLFTDAYENSDRRSEKAIFVRAGTTGVTVNHINAPDHVIEFHPWHNIERLIYDARDQAPE